MSSGPLSPVTMPRSEPFLARPFVSPRSAICLCSMAWRWLLGILETADIRMGRHAAIVKEVETAFYWMLTVVLSDASN